MFGGTKKGQESLGDAELSHAWSTAVLPRSGSVRASHALDVY